MNSPTGSRGKLFVVSAPSGAGKTSLVRALIESRNDVAVAVSHTTRNMRPGEIDGTNYHFIGKTVFQKMVSENAFLEWATVFDNFYGTSRQEVERILDNGQHLILEIDWQGADQIRQQHPEALSIFILPPSLLILRQRLESRGQDDAATVAKRTSAAIEEISHCKSFDYILINDKFEDALVDLNAIVGGHGDHLRHTSPLYEHHTLINQLLDRD